jgi:L-ascorbate metabolism protein UlaG (beta-lactamase superfamily)
MTMGLGNGLRLTWVGHATWIMETPGGKRVLIDPWVTGNPVVPDQLKDPGRFDVLLLTHGHNDHTGDAVELATRHTPKAVLAMIELGDYLEAKGVQNVIGYNKGGTAEAEGLKFTMVDARHSSSFTEQDGTILHTGDPNGYIVTLEDGRRVYVAGDTSVFGDMALIGRLYKPDVAILPIGDFFTMGPFEAAEAIRMLGVKKVVPTHYGTFPALHGTPDQLRREAADVSGLEVLDVAPGGTVA